MACLVNLTNRAQRDLALLYSEIDVAQPEAALKWYCGFKAAIFSLEIQPNRCPATPENPNRAIYQILEKQKQVDVLHIHHGARDKFTGGAAT